MQLGEPRVRTQATHSINVAVKDGPVLDSPGHYRGQRDRRFQVRMLRIRYVDGLLTSVEVDGPILNADGTPNGRGSSGSIDYELPAGGALREDTPDWIRDVVQAHPWPGGADRDALLDLLGAVDALGSAAPPARAALTDAAARARRHLARVVGDL